MPPIVISAEIERPGRRGLRLRHRPGPVSASGRKASSTGWKRA